MTEAPVVEVLSELGLRPSQEWPPGPVIAAVVTLVFISSPRKEWRGCRFDDLDPHVDAAVLSFAKRRVVLNVSI